MAHDFRLLVKNASQVVLICSSGEKFLTKEGMEKLVIIENGSVVIGRDGLIAAVGPADAIELQFRGASFDKVLDAAGMCIIPGLVDAHTHPVWDGDRVHEFSMKLAGATYMDVHRAGGGIHFTVEHTRRASAERLTSGLMGRLRRMLRAGTTLAECKSGYGLDARAELKMLRVIEDVRRALPMGVSATYCGAHAVPRGKSMAEATRDVVDVQLPLLQKKMSSGEIHVDNIDVFCEEGVFDLDSTRTILQAGKRMGLNINFHGDELHPMNAAQLGAELGALAISHLEEVTDEGIAAMATARTAAVLLPTTAYILRLKSPRARDMLEGGVIVALGSDFNPNAYCCSMPIVMHMACVNMKMTLNEALAAATINAAYTLGLSHTHGSLEPGKQGDLLIISAPRWEHLIYQLGGHGELIQYVIIKGSVVYENSDIMTNHSQI
ncbi:putative imidazolonepropionase [Denticeps clupeoides]|uniref:Probable imidazolonepropionase n=1 Tax=Denticeps clupeoides TaxID=299321 RepID=A0AAY4BNR1_9TELE|nr:probable imidazolonepropionase [Denticeps clupeoides]